MFTSVVNVNRLQKESNNPFAESLVTIQNRYGLHGRPTTMFVKLANQFDSAITVSRSEGEGLEVVNGKSAIALLSLGLEYGVKLRIKAEGKDAGEAVEALSDLVNKKFEEA